MSRITTRGSRRRAACDVPTSQDRCSRLRVSAVKLRVLVSSGLLTSERLSLDLNHSLGPEAPVKTPASERGRVGTKGDMLLVSTCPLKANKQDDAWKLSHLNTK